MSKSLFKNNENIDIVALRDWLDWCGGRKDDEYIILPLIQRGSVWKPHQLIDLWDSLLRGLPVGSFMLQRMAMKSADGAEVLIRRPGQKSSEPMRKDGYGLLDGQQRTLAMLTGWPGVDTDRRVWVDFSDKPGKEHLFRLRVTTENHPFGFQQEKPSQKLSLDDRRKAREKYEARHGSQPDNVFPDFRKSFPYRTDGAFLVEVKELIRIFTPDFDVWFDLIMKLEETKLLNEASPKRVEDSARAFHKAIGRLLELKLPIIRLNIDEVEAGTRHAEGEDPALAILFKRVGANGTPLSNADYVFSVIKHHCPQVHDLVEAIHNPEVDTDRNGNIAALLSPTDIVSTAVRLAITRCTDVAGKPFSDRDSIDKEQFHRLMKQEVVAKERGRFLSVAFLPLIEGREEGIGELFKRLGALLSYRGIGDIGLPAHALLLLDKHLIQVLVYWLLAAGAGKRRLEEAERANVIRFVLFWAQCVTDSSRASVLAFREIRSGETQGDEAGAAVFNRIYKCVVKDKRAVKICPPEKLRELVPHVLFIESDSDKPLLGWTRFRERKDEDDEVRQAREFYQHWWWGWFYQNPLLLWLQRDYVQSLPGSPVAGREEDTPYDYDHILPQSHWRDWTGVSKKTPTSIQFHMPEDDKDYWLVGDSIGNVRVWSSADNRSDGDLPPGEKIRGVEVLTKSAIAPEHYENWANCSGGAQKKVWTAERARAFQKAVEERAFWLYERFFEDLNFREWSLSVDEES